MTPQAQTPWAEMLRDGLRLGVAPEVFWRLSVREWRMLTERAEAPSMGRDVFERLASDWPDEEE